MNKLSLSQVLPSAGITSSKATASSKLAANEWTGSSRGCHLGWGSGSSADGVCLVRARMLAPVRDSSTLAERQYTADQRGLAHIDDSSTRDGCDPHEQLLEDGGSRRPGTDDPPWRRGFDGGIGRRPCARGGTAEKGRVLGRTERAWRAGPA